MSLTTENIRAVLAARNETVSEEAELTEQERKAFRYHLEQMGTPRALVDYAHFPSVLPANVQEFIADAIAQDEPEVVPDEDEDEDVPPVDAQPPVEDAGSEEPGATDDPTEEDPSEA